MLTCGETIGAACLRQRIGCLLLIGRLVWLVIGVHVWATGELLFKKELKSNFNSGSVYGEKRLKNILEQKMYAIWIANYSYSSRKYINLYEPFEISYDIEIGHKIT